MMFPHTITIYHHSIENGEDKYERTILEGFYWNGSKSLTAADKGADSEKTTTIISNPENAHKYGAEWMIQPNDMIFFGEGKDIASFREIRNAVTVTGIAVNVCNSDVDNIVITGK